MEIIIDFSVGINSTTLIAHTHTQKKERKKSSGRGGFAPIFSYSIVLANKSIPKSFVYNECQNYHFKYIVI